MWQFAKSRRLGYLFFGMLLDIDIEMVIFKSAKEFMRK